MDIAHNLCERKSTKIQSRHVHMIYAIQACHLRVEGVQLSSQPHPKQFLKNLIYMRLQVPSWNTPLNMPH